MIKLTSISKEEFQALLKWFSDDSEEAGVKYEQIHSGLVRFFRYRGCNDSGALADETINRVANKLDELDLSRGYKKITIFYGFALNVFREYLRDINQQESPQNLEAIELLNNFSETDEIYDERNLQCLKKCLSKIKTDDQILITKYFSKVKKEKINLRKQIAKELKITPNALHVKVFRIKQKLKECIEKCREKNKV